MKPWLKSFLEKSGYKFNDGVDTRAFIPANAEIVFSSTKKVFAHYFWPFPLSIDNAKSSSDYYNTVFFSPTGESSAYLDEGGYLRQRPRSTSIKSDYLKQNMVNEVHSAIASGICGFMFNVTNITDATNSSSKLNKMFDAAVLADSRFKVAPMIDTTNLSLESDVVSIITTIKDKPALYKLDDDRIVVSSFHAELRATTWWQTVIDDLSTAGIEIAFFPTFLSDPPSSYDDLEYGQGTWGTSTVTEATRQATLISAAHSADKLYISPIRTQDYRPKNAIYWEAGNSQTLRTSWEGVISNDGDWVQLVTWNDFSESTQFSQYTDATLNNYIGTGFNQLNKYYAKWFLTGQKPEIINDGIFYFYRKIPTTASHSNQTANTTIQAGSAENTIEFLAFLTADATLRIEINSNTYEQAGVAGIASFKIATEPGVPVFSIVRDGTIDKQATGTVQIYDTDGLPSGLTDLTYWSGFA